MLEQLQSLEQKAALHVRDANNNDGNNFLQRLRQQRNLLGFLESLQRAMNDLCSPYEAHSLRDNYDSYSACQEKELIMLHLSQQKLAKDIENNEKIEWYLATWLKLKR